MRAARDAAKRKEHIANSYKEIPYNDLLFAICHMPRRVLRTLSLGSSRFARRYLGNSRSEFPTPNKQLTTTNKLEVVGCKLEVEKNAPHFFLFLHLLKCFTSVGTRLATCI